MKLEFVSLLATDKLALPALLYTPDKPTTRVTVWLHGMGDNGIFYKSTMMNALGASLTARGIAFLAFNNRGAHGSKHLKIADEAVPEADRDYQGGTYYERITDCAMDITGAVEFLEERGFTTLYLAGHSSGANKICAYDHRQPKSPFEKYVLAGPGDDTGLYFQQLGPKKFWRAARLAAKKASKDPFYILPKYSGMHPFSAQSAWDILNPDGDYNTFPYYEATQERLGEKPLFQEYHAITTKSLVIIGEHDEYAITAGGTRQALDLFMKYTSNAMLKYNDFMIMPDTDHSFHGHEVAFAEHVSDWLTDV